MNINIEQLKEIWQMQQDLDKRIHNEKGLRLQDTVDKRKIALIVELGELLQELPSTFKYWKKGAIDNRGKALEEFVDCLHFALSLTDSLSLDSQIKSFNNCQFMGWIERNYSCVNTPDIIFDIFDYVNDRGENEYLWNLILIGISLKFTWEEIYQGYLAKNAVNHTRQDKGY